AIQRVHKAVVIVDDENASHEAILFVDGGVGDGNERLHPGEHEGEERVQHRRDEHEQNDELDDDGARQSAPECGVHGQSSRFSVRDAGGPTAVGVNDSNVPYATMRSAAENIGLQAVSVMKRSVTSALSLCGIGLSTSTAWGVTYSSV